MSSKQTRSARRFTAWTTHILASDRFFYAVVICFIIQALWLAFTARYPMAFDENFHFGLIQLHAQQWLPFFTHQTASADAYGAVTRDPSYLYHYLMSIPYRLIRIFTSDTTAQIISLRVLNIALFAWAFILIRRLLLKLGGSRPLVNTALFLFSFMPIVPFLAAQINYDNLLVPVAAATLLMAFQWMDDLKRHSVSYARTTVLISTMLLGCLVKYAFLPILVAIGLFMFWCLWRQRYAWLTIWRNFLQRIRKTSRIRLAAASVFFLIAIGLFSQQYVVNIVKYHNPIPDCSKVMSIQECSGYAPWQRDYYYHQHLSPTFRPDFPDYVWQWIYGMWERSFFAISDTFATMPPLPLVGGSAAVVGTAGGALFLFYSRRILKGHPYRQLSFVAIIVYLASLFLDTYKGYVYTGLPVAINGRYLVPFLPILFLLVGFAFARLLRRLPGLKAVGVIVVLLCFLQGGGAMTFILQSDESWNWPNSSVVHANNAARKVLHPLIAGSRQH